MESWHQVINVCAAILPVVVYIVVVYSIDRFALISARRLLMLVLCGVLAGLLCFGIFQLTPLNARLSNWTDPIVEELVKAIPLLVLAWRKKMPFFIDSVVCGAAVGGGFCIVENLLYLLGEPMGVGTALFRGLEVALIHMGCTACVAAGLMFAVRLVERHHCHLEIKRKDIAMTVLLLVFGPILHVAHNAFHFHPVLQFTVVFGAMAGLLVWIWQYDTNMIPRWIDKGLNNQLAVALSLREGKLDDTPTGQYLLKVKNAFSPEVFNDLVRYVQLYTELSVAAKSRFMVREAGLDYPMDEERRQTLFSQYEEYQQLEQRLEASVRSIVAPLLKFYPADRKALSDLIKDCKTKK